MCGKNIKDKEITFPYQLKEEPAGFYSVYSVNAQGFKSDCSNPVIKTDWQQIYEAEKAVHKGMFSDVHPGYSGKGFIVDLFTHQANTEFTIDIPVDGIYALMLSGANGHGPHGTYCAIRSVFIDGEDAGTFILETSGDWTKWLNSNYILKKLKAGKHTVTLKFNPENKGYDFNMSHGREDANDCNLDYLKVIRL